jgi:hypothetical protein
MAFKERRMITRKNIAANAKELIKHAEDHKIRASELERLLIEALHCVVDSDRVVRLKDTQLVGLRAQIEVLNRMTVTALKGELSEARQ